MSAPAAAANRSNYTVLSSSCCLLLSLFVFSVFVPQQCTASVRSSELDVPSPANTGDTSQSDVISNDYCNSNIECGFESNSVCYNGTCICKLGYHWTPQNYKCMHKNCTRNEQCAALFPNTVCDTARHYYQHSLAEHYCVCPTSHLYSKVDQRCIGREEHSNRPSNLQTFIFIAGGIVILLVLVAGGCSGGRWFYLHYRPPTSSSSSSGSGSGGVVTAASMTVNERSPPSSPTPYPPYLSKADHHHDHQFQVVEVVNSVPPPPYTRSPSC